MRALIDHVWGKSSAQDRVWAQVAGLSPTRAERRLFMALNFQAFIDESETAGGEYVLAGHIATAENWAKFSAEWEMLLPSGTLADNGLYHFKMSAMAMTDERMARVPAFRRCIENHVKASISCRMNVEDFDRAHENVERFVSRLNLVLDWKLWKSPYYFLFRCLLDRFHDRSSEYADILPVNEDEKVDFYFDDKTEKSAIMAAWDEIVENRPDKVAKLYGATPRFENDQDFLPLQAADLWAWWVREWYEEDNSPVPDKMRMLDFGGWKGKRGHPIIAISYDEEAITKVLTGITFANAPNAYRIFP